MTIGSFSVKNSVLINILMILALVAGFFSLNRLPQEQFAEVPFFFVNIIVPYPGVSAEDIEQSVTVAIENEMSGIESLDEIQSVTTEGLSRVTIQFDQGISGDEFERLYQEVQNRFTNIDLPDGTLQETIDDFSSNDFLPVIEVVLSGNVPYADLSRAAQNLEDRLRTIPDVSGINLIGARDRQISIELNRERLESLGISLDEVVNAVRAQNVTTPGGTLETGSREFLVRTVGQRETAAQFRSIVIRRGGAGGGGIGTLGDLATIRADYDSDGRSDLFVTNFAADTNTLYRNAASGQFRDATVTAGLATVTAFVGWGTEFLDFDLDGWPDIFVANGHVAPSVNEAGIGESFAQPRLLFWNRGDGKFHPISTQAGSAFSAAHPSRGVATGDLDNDGDVEVVVVNVGQSPSLLQDRSERSANWLMVRAIAESGRDAVGARVTVRADGFQRTSEVRSGGGYLSQSDLRLSFGLGKLSSVEIEVLWPSGLGRSAGTFAANQIVTISEPRQLPATSTP